MLSNKLSFGLSLGVSSREETRRVGDLAQRAERAGIDALWLIDSQLVMRDVYISLAVAAMATDRLRLGTGVTNPATRHVTVTANAIATLDELSDGRALLGIGTGDSALFPLGLEPVKVDDLRATIHTLRGLLRGDAVRIGERDVKMRTARPVPIYVSASQPRMLRLAGELADGVIMMGFAAPDLVEYQLKSLQEGLDAAGRKREEILVDYWATISIRDSEDLALADVRSWAAGQARWLSRWKEVPDSLARFNEEAKRAAAAYDFSEHLSVHAGHGTSVSDDFTRLAAIAGDDDECLRRVQDLAGLGLDSLTFTWLSGGREDRLERLGGLIKRLSPADARSHG
jgi:5,10-methylenetetrahydromethanopterin reductase